MVRKNFPQNKVLRILMTLLLFIFISSALAHAVSAINNPPVFTSGESFWVDENTVYVTTITADDNDSEDNITGYEVVLRDSSTMDSRHFQITNDGVLSFISPPNYENPTNWDPDNPGLYRLAVKVTSGSGSRERTAINRNIYVIVSDVEEFLSFSQNVYTFNLNESEKGNLIPLLLGSVNATSNDNLSNEIIYSITQGNTSKFNINRSNGQITYIGNGEDYESGKIQYNLTVSANDSVNNATANIIVYVNAVNEPPVFSQNSYTFRLDENADGSSNPISIGNVTATDEENDSVNYSITQGNTSKFNIDGSNGQITYIGNGEDYESGTTQYTLTVSANDSVNEETAQIIININNLNDNSPVFNQSSYTFRLDENVVGNSTPVSLGNVTATDEDRDILTYSITQGDTNKFNIGSSTGQITYIGSGEDYENGTIQYNLTVQASDNTNEVTSQVTVDITDIDERVFRFEQIYLFNIDENLGGSSNPVFIGTIEASGTDDDVTYSINTTYNGRFHINSSSGVITYTGRGEDYESENGYILKALATTDRVDYVNTTITIIINNINDNPVFSKTSYNFNLDENADGSSSPISIGNVTATDEDRDILTYSITEGDTDKFDINSSNGEITYTGSGEDYENGTIQYALTVNANDSTSQVSVQVTVDINDLNENTNVFEFERSAYTFSINENEDGSSNPVNVDTVKAINNQGTITYSISAGDTNKFSINSQTGLITYVGSGEDYETDDQFTLTINADDGTSQVNAQVNVNINDLNENTDTFEFEKSAYTFSIDENEDGSSNPVDVGTVNAINNNGTITYSISAGDTSKFSINSQTGEITYIGSGEDHETDDEYTLTVTANDTISQDNVQVTVNVNDVNEPPVFDQNSYSFNLDENEDGSTNPVYVETVNAEDVDDGDNVEYSISAGDTSKFNINSQTGEITYIGSGEDYETDNQYNLTITATDGTVDVTADVTVDINNVDEPLTFNQNSYTFSLDENEDGSSNPVYVNTVNANDPDSNENINYSISEGDTNKFSINIQTGEMTYIGSGEDYETNNTFHLIVMADNGENSATADVTVNINNLNDYGEFGFERSKYVFFLNENADGSTNPVDVGTVNAINTDNNITYSISEGDTNKFSIDSEKGNITYTGSGEDYESGIIQFNLTLTANDGANESTANATININDLDDNKPPIARDDTIEIISGDTTSVLSGGNTSVRDNDEDEDNSISELRVTLISDANYGDLTLNEDGTFTYRHYGNSTTDDNFEYSISDGANSSSATVTISVQEDTSAPNITITSPDNGLSTTNTTVEISFIATDNTSEGAFKPLKFKIFVDNTLSREKVGNSNTTVSHTLSALSIGSHTFWVETTDPAGNSQNSSKTTININNATTPSPSDEDDEDDEDEDDRGTRLDEGEPEEFRIRSGGSSVHLIEVESNERVNDVKIRARKLSRLPSSVDEDPNGEVYEYIDIKASRLDDDEIADASIEFDVDKDWLSDNEFDKEDVVLLRYDEDDDEWEELDTVIIVETSRYVRYSADTPGFGTFAIVVIETSEPENTSVETTSVPTQTVTRTETFEPPTPPTSVEPIPQPTSTPTPKTTPKSVDVLSLDNLIIFISLIAVTLLVLMTAVIVAIKKSRSRRSRLKRMKKMKLPSRSPAIPLERPTPTPVTIQHTSTQHLKKEKQKKPIATTILSGALGIILALVALVSYRMLSPESIDISFLGSLSANTILILSLITVLSAIFALSFKIIKDKSNSKSNSN